MYTKVHRTASVDLRSGHVKRERRCGPMHQSFLRDQKRRPALLRKQGKRARTGCVCPVAMLTHSTKVRLDGFEGSQKKEKEKRAQVLERGESSSRSQ